MARAPVFKVYPNQGGIVDINGGGNAFALRMNIPDAPEKIDEHIDGMNAQRSHATCRTFCTAVAPLPGIWGKVGVKMAI